MDFSRVNWLYFALAVSAIIVVALVALQHRKKASLSARFAALPHILVACLNSAAPVRGYVDPDYVGYGWGFLHAFRGLDVTLTAGAVFLTSLIAAALASRDRRGWTMWFVAAASAASGANIAAPMFASAIGGGFEEMRIQLGEYLTIPGVIAGPLILALLVGPFLFGMIWSLGRTRGA
jgi:hypothetical protein